MAKLVGAQSLVKKLIDHDREQLSLKYKFPSNIKAAKIHTRAKSFGQNIEDIPKQTVCPCCGNQIEKHRFSVLKEDTTKLFHEEIHISSSIAFFFTFIKYVIVMLLIRTIILDAFNMVTNLVKGDYCQGKCSKQLWSFASLLHKLNDPKLIQITDILVLVVTVVFIFYFLAYRRLQYEMYDNIDKEKQTQDDFTIQVSHIPILNFSEQPDSKGHHHFEYDKDLGEMMEMKIRDWIRDLEENQDHGSLEYDYVNFKKNKGESYNDPPRDIIKSISLCYDINSLDRINGIRE